MNDAVIRIRDLTRHYVMGTETVQALRGVTLDIGRNEWVMANLYALDRAPVLKVLRAFLLNGQQNILTNWRRFAAFRGWKIKKDRELAGR